MITCDKCNGECCRDVTVGLDDPENMEDWEDMRWMATHENTSVYLDDDNDWCVEFRTPCSKLDENNKCTMYENRPQKCKEHGVDECIKNGEGDLHKIRFDTIEEIDEYIEKVVKPEMELKKKFKKVR